MLHSLPPCSNESGIKKRYTSPALDRNALDRNPSNSRSYLLFRLILTRSFATGNLPRAPGKKKASLSRNPRETEACDKNTDFGLTRMGVYSADKRFHAFDNRECLSRYTGGILLTECECKWGRLSGLTSLRLSGVLVDGTRPDRRRGNPTTET